MSDSSSVIKSLTQRYREPSWLAEERAAALVQHEKSAAPKNVDEDWRRTDVSKFLVSDLEVNPLPEAVCESAVHIPAKIRDSALFSGPALFTGSISGETVFTTLADAARKNPDLVRKCLAALDRKDASKFDYLADALWNGSLFLYVPSNAKLEAPVSALLRPSGRDQFQKILVFIDRGASANLWLDQSSPDARWINSICDVHIKEGGRLSFLNVQRHNAQATLLSTFNATLERDALLDLMTVEAGSALAKERWNVRLIGENASAKAFGLVRAAGKQHFDETLYVAHLARRAQSEVLFKTVAADESRSIFSGLIHVHKDAQKTQAYQTNRNLLLSSKARTDTIPKLEILADDVKCGHGAAVSSIDEEQIFYLTSRGMTRELAKDVIVEGFYADVLARFFHEDSIIGADRERLHEEVMQSIREILVGKSSLEVAP